MSERNDLMLEQVDEKIRQLELISVQAIRETSPELPGAFLEKHRAQVLEPGGEDYAAVTSEYGSMRSRFLKNLMENPTAHALALIAVGEEGVENMEQGRLPRHLVGTYKARDGTRKPKYESYNCHHMFQKSVQDLSGEVQINSAENLVVINSSRADNNAENAHLYFHALILHPQVVGNAEEEFDFYSIKSAFPFYPPCTAPFESVAEVKEFLAEMDPEAELPDEWAEKIVAFSEVLGHEPFQVPEEFRGITKAFSSLYRHNDKAQRDECAELAAEFTRDRLPAGAMVRNEILPDDHVPGNPVPILNPGGVVTWPKGVTVKPNGELVDKHHSLPDDSEAEDDKEHHSPRRM